MMKTDSRRHLRRTLIPALIAACFSTAGANPTLPQVVNGQATFAQQGNVFSISNTPNAIINWQSFSIAPGEVTRFIQQSDGSAVLNRILGQDPSKILGALQSNGRVFLINPNGILFGNGARVDVNGLTASTLNLSDADFLAGKKNFTAGKVAGAISNQGSITTPGGGQVFLIASDVSNSGVITSPQGEVVLAAGHSVTLVDSANPDLHVVVAAPQDRAINLGKIIAHGGKVGIYGALVNQRGEINANSAVVGENGKIILKASRETLLEAGSVTSASGAGIGGDVRVLGERVGLTGDASINASGATGGGSVLVGGDYQGKNALLPNAQQTYFGKDASIRADATGSGNGGKVVIWSDQATRAFGRVSARGGALAGDGGMVETSGHRLDVHGIRVDGAAPAGKRGSWLLDPLDITVISGSASATLQDAGLFSNLPEAALVLDPGLINSSDVDVQLQATHDITFASPITNSKGIALSAQAGNNITVNAPIALTGALKLRAGDQGGTGAVTVNSSLNTGNADLLLAGQGIAINAGALNAGSGNIDVRANSAGGTIALASGSSVAGHFIDLLADNVSINGTVGAGGANGNAYVSINPFTHGRDIVIGAKTGGALSLDEAELNRLTAFEINLGSSAHTGTLAVGTSTGAGITLTQVRNLVLETGGNIHVNQPLAVTQDGSTLLAGVFGNGSITVASAGSLSAASTVLRADAMALDGAITGSAAVQLMPNNGATAIDLGTGAGDVQGAPGVPGTLGLSSAEIGTVSTPSLIIGAGLGQTGNMRVVGALDASSRAGELVLHAGSGNLGIDAPLTAAGPVALISNGGAITEGSNGAILASNGDAPLALLAAGGSVNLGGANAVRTISGQATGGNFLYRATNAIEVGVSALSGIYASEGIVLKSDEGIQQMASAPLNAQSLFVLTAHDRPGSVLLGAENNVGAIAAQDVNVLSFHNAGDLTVGVGNNGINAIGSLPFVDLSSNTKIVVSRPVSAVGGPVNLSAPAIQVGLPVLATIESGGTTTSDIIAETVALSAPLHSSGRVSISNGVHIEANLVQVSADQMAFETSARVGAANSSVSLQPFTDNRAVDLGAGAADTQSRLGLSQFDLGAINASSLFIGDHSEGATGGITVVGALDLTSSPHLASTVLSSGRGGTTVNAFLSVPGNLFLTTQGNLSLQAPVSAASSAVLAAATGSIGGSGVLKAPTVTMSAANGIGSSSAPLDTQTTLLSAINSRTESLAPIRIRNNAGAPALLEVAYVTQAGAGNDGPIAIENFGGMTVSGAVNSQGGTIGLLTHSPLTIDGTVGSTSGQITLEAGGGGNLVIGSNGHVNSTTGAINLVAGGTVTAPAGAITTAGTITGATAPAPALPPTLETCTANPAVTGCAALLAIHDALLACIANPQGAGCAAVLPSLPVCQQTPALEGCAPVLQQAAFNACVANPQGPNCGAILPPLSICVASPATPGCSVVLPALATCAADLAAPGCSAVLPSLASCAATPATPGCGAVISCLANPAGAGCSAVLPPLASCQATPAAAGCSVVLQQSAFDACVLNPAGAACPTVLPTLAACAAAPSTPGCSVVNICLANKDAPGCTSFLPSLALCVATPGLAGCGVVLPSFDLCLSQSQTAGCSARLPTLGACVSAPATAGCGVVLPSVAQCVAAPALPGCATVLPTLAACIASPAAAGCSVTLPPLVQCVSNPATAGCSAVLPSVAVCISNPTAAGCSAVLPSLAQCTANPILAGCSAVLPTLAQCTATPTLAGCGAVLPPVERCIANPASPGCSVVVPPTQAQTPQSSPVSQAINTTVQVINQATTAQAGGSSAGASGNSTGASSPGADSPASNASDDKKETTSSVATKTESGAKNEPVKKMYCN